MSRLSSGLRRDDEDAGKGSMQCPRDKAELEHEGFWKYPRHSCPSCRGVFVLERDLTEGLGHAGPKKLEAVAAVKLDNLGDSDLRCPKDDRLLKAVHFADAEIDVCPACNGLWLDHGEFEKIVARMRQRTEAIRPNPRMPEPEVKQGSSIDVDGVLDFLGDSVRAFWRGVRLGRRL